MLTSLTTVISLNGTSPTLLCGQSRFRKRVEIHHARNGGLGVVYPDSNVTVDNGFRLSIILLPNFPKNAEIFTKETHGDLVTRAFFGICSSIGDIVVIETFDTE